MKRKTEGTYAQARERAAWRKRRGVSERPPLSSPILLLVSDCDQLVYLPFDPA
jgi:hypothetical protein